jgi:membrane protease YdiL (CAAX protease family)
MLQKTTQARLFLALIGIVSIGLIVLTDNAAVFLLERTAPSLRFLGQIRLPSLLLCFGFYFYSRRFNEATKSAPRWKETLRTAALWLIPTAYFVLVKKVWVPQISGWVDITAFMITGLLAEELLFRGCIYNLAAAALPSKKLWRFSAAALVSSLLFGLQHIAYHRFQLTPASVVQIAYTFVMGLFLASVRESSGRLWPAWAVHTISNVFTLFRA